MHLTLTMKIGSKVQDQTNIPSSGSKHNGSFLKTSTAALMNTLRKWIPAALALLQVSLHCKLKRSSERWAVFADFTDNETARRKQAASKSSIITEYLRRI